MWNRREMSAWDRPPYLVGLFLRDRLTVLVGAGHVVARRLPKLLASGAIVRVISPECHPTVAALAASGEVTWVERGYAPDDLTGAWYAIAATNDPVVNAAVVAEANERRVFCVRADDGSAGTAVTPATATHDGLDVAVLASGNHRRSRAIRNRILAELASDPSPNP